MCDSAPITVTVTSSIEPPIEDSFPIVPVAVGLGILSVVSVAYFSRRKK